MRMASEIKLMLLSYRNSQKSKVECKHLDKAIARTWERLLKPQTREVHFWNDRNFVICWQNQDRKKLEVRYKISSLKGKGKIIASATGTEDGLHQIIERAHACCPYLVADVNKFRTIESAKVSSTAARYFDGAWVQKSRTRTVR